MEEEQIQYFPSLFNEFVPEKEQILINFEGQESQRILFGKQLFSEEENRLLEEFVVYLKSQKITYPPWVMMSDEYILLRFLQGNNGNFERTAQCLKQHVSWRAINLPIEIEDVEHFLNTGLLYFLGRDYSFRPILILNLRKAIDSKITKEEFGNVCIFLMEFMKENLLAAGKVESLFSIIDMKDVGITETPNSLLQGMMELLQNNYRARLFRLFLINTPFLISGAWAVVTQFLEKFTTAKIKVIRKEFHEELHSYIPLQQLENKFGGLQNDLIENFFPPRMNINNYVDEA